MEIVVATTGELRCVYSEAINLHELGQLSIRRASHVEPTPDGRWWADLMPVNGPILGPFVRRAEALAAELRWLEANWLPQPR